jgi:sugar O-acyltransferase (sialic acid O-acetyltransferase NeuD family)
VTSAIYVYGSGGHAQVVVDILELGDLGPLVGLLDDDKWLHGQERFGYRVLGSLDQVAEADARIVIGIGDNTDREQTALRAEALGLIPITVTHPAATVASGVTVGDGTVVMAGAVVNPGTVIGRHAIINTSSSIDHDCVIGDFAHISPGAHLGGSVTVELKAHLGIGVSVIPGITIGEGAVIGAGASVIRDVPPGAVAVGVPAQIISQHNRN